MGQAMEGMATKQHIHIFGASGAGTTTIAGMVCQRLGYRHLDADDYFWLPTANPFTEERPRGECLHMMDADLSQNRRWVLSGSLATWGDSLIPYFDLAVFVYVPPDIRLARLQKRELERYGNDAAHGGKRYEETQAFLAWAAAYDAGTRNGRSLPKHEAWLAGLSCKTLRIVNDDLETSVKAVMQAMVE